MLPIAAAVASRNVALPQPDIWHTVTTNVIEFPRAEPAKQSQSTHQRGWRDRYEDLCRAAECARTLASQSKAWGDERLSGKIAGGADRPTKLWQQRENALNFIYYEHTKKRGRAWPLSRNHIDETTLARRYGMSPISFPQWCKERNFPSPICDFHPFKTPTKRWWHRAAVSEWERARARPITVISDKPKARYGERIIDGDPLSDEVVERSKALDLRAKETRRRRKPKLSDDEINALASVALTDQIAFSKIVAELRSDFEGKARGYAKYDKGLFDELVACAIAGNETVNGFANGIPYALKRFILARGVPFRIFAKESIRWAMTAHLERVNAQRQATPRSLDEPKYNDDDGRRETVGDYEINETTYSDDALERFDLERYSARLNEALDGANLSQRERLVFEGRHGLNGNPARSLVEIGEELNLSRERVRQIEISARRKLDAFLTANQCVSEQTGNGGSP